MSSVMTQIQLTDTEGNEIVSSAMTQFKLEDIRESILAKISWTHHLALISGTASDEEREFYIRLCIRENYSVRELERQISSSVFERVMLGNASLPAALKEIPLELLVQKKGSGIIPISATA